MASLFLEFARFLSLGKVDIDNLHSKLYYKLGTFLFLCGSLVGGLRQYIGDPINCDFDRTISTYVAADYCWLV